MQQRYREISLSPRWSNLARCMGEHGSWWVVGTKKEDNTVDPKHKLKQIEGRVWFCCEYLWTLTSIEFLLCMKAVTNQGNSHAACAQYCIILQYDT